MTALAANYRIYDLPWTPDEGEPERLRKTARTLLLVFADGRELYFGEFASLPAAEQWEYFQAQPEEADDDE